MSPKQPVPPKQSTLSAQVTRPAAGNASVSRLCGQVGLRKTHMQPMQGGVARLVQSCFDARQTGATGCCPKARSHPSRTCREIRTSQSLTPLITLQPSPLMTAWPASLFQPETEAGKFNLIGKPNARGFLWASHRGGHAGKDAQDARTKVYRALASSLSNVSIQLDIPFYVYQSDMIELLSTGNRFISIISPHLERPMQIAPTGNHVEGVPQPCRPLPRGAKAATLRPSNSSAISRSSKASGSDAGNSSLKRRRQARKSRSHRSRWPPPTKPQFILG